jgi:hypothetical protein
LNNRKRRERLMPNGIPRYIRIYDLPISWDRYTVVYTKIKQVYKFAYYPYLGMSEDPTQPYGFGQHGSNKTIIDRPRSRHLGRRIKFQDLPEPCQNIVISDYEALWSI